MRVSLFLLAVLGLLLSAGCEDTSETAQHVDAPSPLSATETHHAATFATPSPPTSEATPPSVGPQTSGVLRASNRNRLAICVEGLDAAAAAVPDVRQHTEQALSEVLAQYPTWAQTVLAALPPVVEAGCPDGPYLLQPGALWEDGVPITGYGQQVAEASPYMVHIYLLPPEVLERVIRGQHDVRAAAQELLCQGHQCFEVTTGVYLTSAEGVNPEFLQRWLARGLGLESRTGLPPNAPISDPQRR